MASSSISSDSEQSGNAVNFMYQTAASKHLPNRVLQEGDHPCKEHILNKIKHYSSVHQHHICMSTRKVWCMKTCRVTSDSPQQTQIETNKVLVLQSAMHWTITAWKKHTNLLLLHLVKLNTQVGCVHADMHSRKVCASLAWALH